MHAAGQVVSFRLPLGCRLTPAQIRSGTNANCPAAVRVLKVARAPTDFSARHTATGKLYRYRWLPIYASALVSLAQWPATAPAVCHSP